MRKEKCETCNKRDYLNHTIQMNRDKHFYKVCDECFEYYTACNLVVKD